jgi:hypothetical protein
MKVGIIGAGAVGSACLTALVARRCAREIAVSNRDRKRAQGLVTDVQYGAVIHPTVEVRDGDYGDVEGASLVTITAGVNERTGGATNRNDPAGRLRLLDANVEVYKGVTRGYTQWPPARSSWSLPIRPTRWLTRHASWVTKGSLARGHISIACGSAFTWLVGSGSTPTLSMCRYWYRS